MTSQEDYQPETEALSFDKADEAESLLRIREKRDALNEEIEGIRKRIKEAESSEDKKKLKTQAASLEGRKKWLEELIKIKEE